MNDKLISIQQELKAPKGQTNSFGNYKYRSAEDILEAVKPLLKKHNLSLCLTDEVVCVGEKNYVKATVQLNSSEPEGSVSADAYAREAVTKKGMDDAQITGSASSYARKYALNGLFAIDDTKDADSDEHTNQLDGSFKAQELAKSKQKLFDAFKEKGIKDSEVMMEKIRTATGKDLVETVSDVAKVIKSLDG